MLIGAPGTGKSQLLQKLIKQAIDRNDTCIIYDEKMEFTGLFYDENSTILIAPFDKRTTTWNISADIRSLSDAKNFAEAAIQENDKDPIWHQASRLLLIGGFLHCIDTYGDQWGWKEIADFISLDEIEMFEALKKSYPLASKLISEGSKSTQSILLNIISSLSWLFDLAIAFPNSYKDKNAISINDFLTKKSNKRVIIIQNSPMFSAIAEPLINIIITLLTDTLLSLENSNQRKVWFFIDELGNLRRNKSILKILSLGRSKGSIFVCGLQDLSLVEETFGRNLTTAISSMISTLIILRVSGIGDTAQFISHALGKRRIERPQSQPNGKTMWQSDEIPLVDVSDIVSLPQASKSNGINGYLSISGWKDTFKLRWKLSPLPKIAEESIPANWTQSSFKPLPANHKGSGDIEISQVAAGIDKKPAHKNHQDIEQNETIVDTFYAEDTKPEKVFDGDISSVNVISGTVDPALALGGATTILELLNESEEVSSGNSQQSTTSLTRKVKKNRLRKRRELEEEIS